MYIISWKEASESVLARTRLLAFQAYKANTNYISFCSDDEVHGSIHNLVSVLKPMIRRQGLCRRGEAAARLTALLK